MNKTLSVVLLVALLAVGAYVIARRMTPAQPPAQPAGQAVGITADSSQPSPGALVFALKYRGFDTPDDPLRDYSSSIYMGREDPNNPFVQAVKRRVQEYTLVHHLALPRARQSVIELKDKRPVALYFDANGDGHLAENERFLPIQPAGPNSGYSCAFVTSDFMLRTQNGGEIPFRLMLLGMPQRTGQVYYAWSSACVLEGQATLADKPTKLILYADGFTGSFTTPGLPTLALLPAEQKLEGRAPRRPLSSLIQYEGTFYRVRLSGTHEKDKTVSVTLEKDTTPTGGMLLAFPAEGMRKARFTSATIVGATDNSIRFNVEGNAFSFPAGQYRLSRADFTYGAQSDTEWKASFGAGPTFDINADKTSRVELGALTLSVGAINDNERYQSSVQERSTFAQGTPIYLTPHIKGKAGEIYDHFAQKATGSNSLADVKPHVTITDPGGKLIVSADMAYG